MYHYRLTKGQLTKQGFCWDGVVQLLLELRLAHRGEDCCHLKKIIPGNLSIYLKDLRLGITFFPLLPSSLAPEICPPFLGLSTQSHLQAVLLSSVRSPSPSGCADSQSQASPHPPVHPRAVPNWVTLSSSSWRETSRILPPDSSHSDLASK